MFAASDQPRILHLVSNSRWTGVAEPATSLASEQMAAGWQVWMACIWGRSMDEQLRKRGFHLATDLRIPRRINPLATLRDVRHLREFLIHNKIQVVHCHQLHEHWLAALALRGWKGSDRPLLVRTVHRYEPMRKDPWHTWLFARATELLITVSTEQSDLIRAAYPNARANVEVIFGGIDPDRFSPNPAGARQVRADMGESADAIVGGIVAHLGYNRGHRWLLKALPAALTQAPNGVVWIVGRGELRRELRQVCKDPKFFNRLVMAGYRSDDLPETYSAMDFSMLLGLGSEGSARAALEAMACAKPVIAVDRGALNDTISNGVDGFLVAENDVAGLTECLVKLLTNRELCQRMGTAAREKVLAKFTEHRRFEVTSEAYARAAVAR